MVRDVYRNLYAARIPLRYFANWLTTLLPLLQLHASQLQISDEERGNKIRTRSYAIRVTTAKQFNACSFIVANSCFLARKPQASTYERVRIFTLS